MQVVTRISLVLLVLWLLVAHVYIVALPLGFWYIVRFNRAYELVLVTVLVDGYYQAFYTVPVLTLSTLFLVFFVDIIKPQLLVYTGHDEIIS